MQANDQRAFRDALGRFATGVTVVTALAADGRPIGLTANSFASVSLTPPLVLWSLDKRTPRFDDYRRCSHYAISVLAADQIDISQRFASPVEDKFAGLSWTRGLHGTPILANMHTIFQCANKLQYEGGDHLIFVGEVLEYEQRYAEPLLFVGGRYAAAVDHPDFALTPAPEPVHHASGRFIDDYLAYLIGRASFLINRQFDRQLKANRVEPAAWRVLASLADGGLATAELAELVLMRPESLAPLLRRMAEDGLLRVAGDTVEITEAGRSRVATLLDAAKSHEDQVLAEYSFEQRVELKRMLEILIERARS